MKHLRAHTWLCLALLVLLLLPAGMPAAAVQPSLDETWIAFTSLAPGEEGIWVVHPDGSGLGRLTEGRDLYPTWSPDGSLLAYVHEVSGTLLYGNVKGYASEIRVVDTAGRIRYTIGQNEWVEGEPVTPLAGSVGLPQWSSDGQALSYGVDLQFFFIVAWGGRRTFYLSPPRIEVGYGPEGGLLAAGTVMLDQSWAPGPVPTWVRSSADLASCQVMSYDTPLLNTTTALYFNPRWSPSGEHLTVYQQSTRPDQFANALLQINAAGEVERILLESESLYLYTIAEPSPDGQRHLIGVSADASVWFLQALAGTFQEPGALSVLPLEPPPTGYLYVLDAAGARTVVAQPQRGTVDLVGRQSWSPDGAEVVFMRAPHPAAEGASSSGLGIYVGPPGQARRLVPFSAAQLSFELTMAYPAWQPLPQGPLPTMVPLLPVSPEATAAPTLGPTAPYPTTTATPTPRPAATATPSPTPTLAPTLVPTPAGPTGPSTLRTILLVSSIVLALVLVVMIIWILLRPEGAEGGGRSFKPPAFLTGLFKPRQASGEAPARNPLRRLLSRRAASGEEKAPSRGTLLRRPKSAAGEAAPKKPAPARGRRPQPAAGEAAPKKRLFAFLRRRPQPTPVAPAAPAAEPPPVPSASPAELSAGEVAPEAAFPSWRARREEPADWPAAEHRPTATAPAGPAGELPGGEPEPGPVTAPPDHPPSDAGAGAPGTARPPLLPDQELLRQGIAQVRAGQFGLAMDTLQKVIQRTPEEGTAWLWLGWAAAQQNQRVLAERCFGRAQELGVAQAEQALAWLRAR